MTSKKTLDLARQWAADIDVDRQTLSQDTIDATAHLISSLPDQWVDAEKLREVVADHHIDMSEELMEALGTLLPVPEPAAPRPEDVPMGEPWLVEVGEREAIGYRNDPLDRFSWIVIYRSAVDFEYALDEEITLIARLVPETAEQDDKPVVDSGYIVTDRDGDEWGYLDGRWVAGTTHAERVARRESFPGHISLPEGFGPYTRIEKEEAHE